MGISCLACHISVSLRHGTGTCCGRRKRNIMPDYQLPRRTMGCTTRVLLALCLSFQLLHSVYGRYSFCKGLPAYKQPPAGQPPEPVVLKDDQFVTAKGKVVHMKAVNWFGFNNGQSAPDGLWAGGSAATTDFATIAYQLRLLGFNGVRLPFTFKDLRAPIKAGWIKQPCAQVDLATLAKRTIDPQEKNPDPLNTAPEPDVPLPSTKPTCNSYLPDTSTLDRYLWTVQWFVANDFYVLVDYHPMGLDDASYNTNTFVSSWQWLWTAISCLPNFESGLKGRVLLDLMNEPDSMGQRWESTVVAAGRVPGVMELYLKTMDALDTVTPGVPLYFIEGAGQLGLRGVNWGNGFVTDNGMIARNALSDPNPFFKALLNKAYRNRVVIAPHVYGPSVSGLTDTTSGDAFFKVLDASFGYLTKRGYCINKDNCQRFPVAIGEFGNRFKDPGDLKHLNDFASYLNNQGAGATGQHNAIGNWYYWSYNANSGDTGGLVDDSWQNWLWNKLRWLQQNLGLEPWYTANNPDTPPTQSQPQPVPMPDASRR